TSIVKIAERTRPGCVFAFDTQCFYFCVPANGCLQNETLICFLSVRILHFPLVMFKMVYGKMRLKQKNKFSRFLVSLRLLIAWKFKNLWFW
ncbi:MAG: hypothetical protein J6S81_06365, partial [Treponema sp.]|nr:hypothetical protein [Treponema sp.]